MQNLHNLSFSNKELGRIIRGFYKNAKIIYAKRLARGIMNYVAEIKITNPSKVFILKISNQEKKYSIEKEVFVIELLRKHKIPAPKIIKYDYSKRKFPFEILMLEKFKGEILNNVWNKIDRKNQAKIAYKLGNILSKINSIKFKRFAAIHGYKKFKYYKNYYEAMKKDFRDIIKKHKEIKFLEETTYKRVNNVFKKFQSLLLSLKKPVLVHNDFWFDHVFIKKFKNEYKVEGIIDFGFAGIFPKEMDFVKPHRWIFDKGKDIEDAFMKGYQKLIKLDKNFKTLLILFRVDFDLFFIYRLYKTKQFKLAEEYKKGLDKFLTMLEDNKT